MHRSTSCLLAALVGCQPKASAPSNVPGKQPVLSGSTLSDGSAAATKPDAVPVKPPTTTTAAGAPIWSGEADGARFEWTVDGIFLRAGDAGGLDLLERSKSEPGCEGEQTDRLLSVVGSIVSYEEFVGTTC